MTAVTSLVCNRSFYSVLSKQQNMAETWQICEVWQLTEPAAWSLSLSRSLKLLAYSLCVIFCVIFSVFFSVFFIGCFWWYGWSCRRPNLSSEIRKAHITTTITITVTINICPAWRTVCAWTADTDFISVAPWTVQCLIAYRPESSQKTFHWLAIERS